MDVSRGTLREAMRVLEQEGLLCSVPHRGTYVRRIDARDARELQEVCGYVRSNLLCRPARKRSILADQIKASYTAAVISSA